MRTYIVDIYFMCNEDCWSEIVYKGTDKKKALETWVNETKKHPTCVSINCQKKNDALDLLEYARDNFEWLTRIGTPTFPYKWSYIFDAINKKIADGCRGFIEGKDEYMTDQIHPFDLG